MQFLGVTIEGNGNVMFNICQGTSLCAVTVVEQIQKGDPVLSQSELIEIDDPHFYAKFIDE